MGTATLKHRALGRWSFAPMMIAVSSLAGITFVNPAAFGVIENGVLPVVFGGSWMLLGVALLTAPRRSLAGFLTVGQYRSPSEARQAVLAAAVSAGLNLPQVLARLETGVWPGLASFYTRYRHRNTRRKALLADWRNAVAFIAGRPEKNPTAEPCA